jgi:hypothetical protein
VCVCVCVCARARACVVRACVCVRERENSGLCNEHKLASTTGFSGVCDTYCSDQTNTQKLQISTKIDVCMYTRSDRHACCSCGALCRGLGAVMCDTQPLNVLKIPLHPQILGILQTFTSQP